MKRQLPAFFLCFLALTPAICAAEELIRTDFSSGHLPPEWFCESQDHSFGEEGLWTGSATGFVIPLRGFGWQALRVELDVRGGTSIKCTSDGVLGMSISLPAAPYPRHQAMHDQHVLACNTEPAPAGEEFHVTFTFERDRIAAAIQDRCVLETANPRRQVFTGTMNLAFRGDCRVRKLRIVGDEPLDQALFPLPPRPDVKSNRGFPLEVAIDFPDDLIRTPFDKSMLNKLFAELASWGTRRVHWIYTGTKAQGFLDHFPLSVSEHAEQTYQKVGELFPAAVRAAHDNGLEIFALFKPFDMGLRWTYGEGTTAAANGRLARIGGPAGWITHFAAEHRELVMARKPGAWGEALNPVWTRLDIVKDDDRPAAISVGDVQLFVSDDNARYRPYDGAIRRTEVIEDYPLYEPTPSGPGPIGARRHCRVLRLDELSLRQKYVAVAVTGREKSFGNTLCNLLHVYGEKGEERRLTYALAPRHADRSQDGSTSPWQTGFEFDRFPGSPTATFGGGYDAIGEPLLFDASAGAIALARGKERETFAALSPSFAATREHWLAWVKDALDSGADGLELRLGNHQADFAWGEYGFEQPVRDAFLARHDVDLWKTDQFDREAWRRLRGEAYTQFVREARQLVHSRGKQFGLHIEWFVDTEPEVGSAMNIHWDWRTWIGEGLPDTISAKSVWPGSRLQQELHSLAHHRGIPVTYAPYAINWFTDYWGTHPKHGGAQLVEQLMRSSRASGYDAFQLYECAAVVAAKPEGKVVMREPELRRMFQRHFRIQAR